MTSAWPVTEGAVKPTLRAPSLLMAEPRMTAWMVSPSARASARRLRTTRPRPLPKRAPWAWASKVRQWPSGDSWPPGWKRWPATGGTRTETPPARARSHSPEWRLWQARWVATREVEQKVWTARLGPVRFSLYDTLVANESLSL